MKIPSDPISALELYENLARACMVSQATRRSQYQRFKRYYLLGCDEGFNPNKVVNKIFPHVEQLTSFMYAQETTRFSVEPGVSASGLNFAMVEPLSQKINEVWHASDTDSIFGLALTWAWVYGTMLLKPIWHGNNVKCGLVEPGNFGVLREDAPDLENQEAFCHEYLITKTQLLNELQAARMAGSITPERIKRIMDRVQASSSRTEGDMGGPANIVVTTIQPLIAGNFMTGGIDPNLYITSDYRPRVYDALIQMRELYVWDDDAATYRVVTMADPYVPIWDRPLKDKMGIEGDAPFFQVCPRPAADYFWGYSEVDPLIALQDLRNERIEQIFRLLQRQADPPWDFSGYTVTDEIMASFNTPGGRIATDMPNAKAQPHQPTIPTDLWADVREIDTMFEETSGLQGILAGRGEPGVRSAGQANTMARLGSSRAKKRAMVIEDSLEDVATYYLKLLQHFSSDRMRTDPIEEGEQAVPFTASQFTDDYRVKVDGHSSSPVFVEDEKELVFAMLKAGLIDKETALDMLPVSGKQLLITRLKRKIEPAEARAAEVQERLQLVSGHGPTKRK